jgi:hypothetical protein
LRLGAARDDFQLPAPVIPRHRPTYRRIQQTREQENRSESLDQQAHELTK